MSDAMHAHNDSPGNAWISLLIAMFFIGACLPLAWAMWQPMGYVIERFTPDDVYYYLKTAMNIAQGHGSTFDGINKTNGYHPLWMLLLVPIYKICGINVELPLRIVLSLQVFMLLLSMWLTFVLIQQHISTASGILAAFLLYGTVGVSGFYGLESHLLVLVTLIGAWFCTARPHVFNAAQYSRDDFTWGVLLGLITLSRLDTIFLFVAYMLMLFASGIRKRQLSMRKLLAVIIPYGMLLGGYLSWNYVYFGHLMPISGALKTAFPNIVLVPRHLLIKAVLARMFFALVAAFAFFSMLVTTTGRKWVQRRPALTITLTWLNLYVLLHACYTTFLQDWGVFPWYFALSLAIASLTFAALGSMLYERFGVYAWVRKAIAWAVSIIVIATVSVMVCKLHLPSRHYGLRKMYQFAIWLREHTPNNAIFIAEDAGIIGYFSERSIINLDGLINSYEYQEYLRRGEFADYIRDKGVRYFISTRGHPRNYTTFRYRAYSQLYNVPGGFVELHPEQEIKDVSQLSIGLWDLRVRPSSKRHK